MSGHQKTVRTLLVEDEAHALRTLREYVVDVPWIELVGEARDGKEAIARIDELRPDLVFLDIALPEASGLDVLQGIRHQPAFVFTTAFDRHAITAFELGALDYLLKPFGRGRFATMLERVRRRVFETTVPPAERARSTLVAPLELLFARTADGIVPIDVRTIVHVQASGDYVEVHCDRGHFLLHLSLTDLGARLDSGTFFRVHRSHLVNLKAIERLRPYDARRLEVQLRGGHRILASREASEALRRLTF